MMGNAHIQGSSRPRVRPLSPSPSVGHSSFGWQNGNGRSSFGQHPGGGGGGGGGMFRHEFTLDSAQTAIVIGRGGASIKCMETESGARMHMHRDPRPDGTKLLEITARNQQCLENAKQVVNARLEGCGKPIIDGAPRIGGDRFAPSASQFGSAVRGGVRDYGPPASMRQNGMMGGRGGGRGGFHGGLGGRSGAEFGERDRDAESRESNIGRAPMPKAEPQVFDSIDVPCEKSAMLKQIDCNTLQDQMGVRIRQTLYAARPSRITISGPKGKVAETMTHLQKLLDGIVPSTPPVLANSTEPVASSGGFSSSEANESENEMKEDGSTGNGVDGTSSTTAEDGPKLGGEGGVTETAEIMREKIGAPMTIETGCEAIQSTPHVQARRMKGVEELKEKLGSMRIDVSGLKKADSTPATAAPAMTEMNSVLKSLQQLTSLRTELRRLKDERKKPLTQPMCDTCGVELCQVLGSCSEVIICSKNCKGCNAKKN